VNGSKSITYQKTISNDQTGQPVSC